jgi:hypothetical protein
VLEDEQLALPETGVREGAQRCRRRLLVANAIELVRHPVLGLFPQLLFQREQNQALLAIGKVL